MSDRAKATVKASTAKTEKAVTRMRQPEGGSSCASPAEQVIRLQRTFGNQAMQRLFRGGIIQTKLRTGQPLSKLHVGPLVQRAPLGIGGGALGTYVARPGDSLSLIAGYPKSGWEQRLDQLIAANRDHPNIKNRTPDDPHYGWLEIGDVITIPWAASATPAPLPSTPASPGTAAPAPFIKSWGTNAGQVSADNCCSACTYKKLGVDSGFYSAQSGRNPSLRNSITNGIEVQARISNHVPTATYDIKRVIERNSWERQGSTAPWAGVRNQYKGPGTNDDPNDLDECLMPKRFASLPDIVFIYSLDHPGLNPDTLSAASTEAVYKASFTESVEITDAGTTTTDPYTLDWHSILWITKSGGTWTADKTKSEIKPGAVTVGTNGP